MPPKRPTKPDPAARAAPREPWPEALIFVTGGAILALELLASRIMTPYFGVSLYIWAGILSVTLVALAAGYWLGGWAARRLHSPSESETGRRLLGLFLLMPAIASLALGVAALIYPWVFLGLARLDLVAGALIACLILLLVPLVATSSMNPLLVALRRTRRGVAESDAGAGRVFFISTLGSVLGVPVTAFLLIPNFSNFGSVTGLGLVLGLATVLIASRLRDRLARAGQIALLGGACAVLCGALLIGANSWLGRDRPIRVDEVTSVNIEREYRSVFGTIKILRESDIRQPAAFALTYFQDGIIQNRAVKGRSWSLFTYALEGIGMAFRPDARSALMLGLGAGIIPMRLAARGVAVEIVEINPGSWAAAQDYFGFDPGKFRNHQVDARTFVEACAPNHDLVLVDLFQGDGIPEHLLTREFFAGLRHCLVPGGGAVFNSFAEAGDPDTYVHLLATLKSVFAEVAIFGGRGEGESEQTFILASDAPIPPDLAVVAPADLPGTLKPAFEATFAALRPATPELMRGGRVVTDDENFLPWSNLRAFLKYRRQVIEYFPTALLVN